MVVALLVGACTASPSPGGSSSTATIAAGSPWLGTFTSVGLPPPVNALTGLDCVTASACWAVGSTIGSAGSAVGAAVIATTDGGGTWVRQSVPATVGYLSGIACSDTRQCTAVGQAGTGTDGVIIATTDGGSTWTQLPAPSGTSDITAVTCGTDRRCMAIASGTAGTTALVSTSPTSPWATTGTLPAAISGATDLSCPDDRHCWVTAHTMADVGHVAGVVVVTSNGGTTWATLPTPPGVGYLNGVSCLHGPTDGSGALPFTSTSTTSSLTAATPVATTVPTPATTTTPAVAGVRCVVVGTTATAVNGVRTGHGVILLTSNGGATWANQSVTATAAALMDVSCTAIGTCVTVGSSVALSAQAGVTLFTGPATSPWKQEAVVGSPQPLTGVSCVSLSRCVAVGESISEHLTGG